MSERAIDRSKIQHLSFDAAIWKIGTMKITKNIGMLLLAIYLIIDGLLGFGLNLGPAIFLLYLVALAAGIFILIAQIKLSPSPISLAGFSYFKYLSNHAMVCSSRST